jgi:hypothetical protein
MALSLVNYKCSGGSNEKEFPEAADTMAPGGFLRPSGAFFILVHPGFSD